MQTENKVLMEQAREALKGKWKLAVGTYFLYMLMLGVMQAVPAVGPLVSLVVSGPLMLGMTLFSISISRNKEAKLEQLFEGFKRFSKALAAYLLMVIFTLLWMLLLVVPGIIAAISYSQLFFILAEDESISAGDALKKSKKMMYGYKWKFFCLVWRFFGWGLLSALTLGIGLFWLIPYIQVSMAKFYDDILNKPITPTPAQQGAV